MRATFYLAAIVLFGCGNTVRDERARGQGGAASATSSSRSASTGSGAGGVAVDYCGACREPEKRGALVSPEIGEASGMAASRTHANTYYVHNDSGDSARLFAIAADGTERGRIALQGVTAIDWEDAATGPCDSGDCIFIGDIGDNAAVRSSYQVHLVDEPATIDGEQSVAARTLMFRYPDGSHDSETLMVHPIDGRVYLVTKVASGPSQIFRFPAPLEPGSEVTLELVGEVTPPQGIAYITAGDIEPHGRGVLLRSYTNLFFYALGASLPEALAVDGCQVPVASEAQGETVAWTAAGDGYLTVSEGVASPVSVAACGP